MTIRRLPVIQPTTPTEERPSGVYPLHRKPTITSGTRSVTISLRATRYTIEKWLGDPEEYPEGVERPKTRGDCLPGGMNEQRPCPFVSCENHLYLDCEGDERSSPGAIQLNFPNKEVSDLRYTCALDLADRGGATLDEVGRALDVTRERIRQLETQALEKLARRAPKLRALIDELNDVEATKREREIYV